MHRRKGYRRADLEDAFARHLVPERGTPTPHIAPEVAPVALPLEPSEISDVEGRAGDPSQRDLDDADSGSTERVARPARPEQTSGESVGRNNAMASNGHPQIGDEGFTEFIKSAYRAGHITHDEVLERLRMHGLLTRAEEYERRRA